MRGTSLRLCLAAAALLVIGLLPVTSFLTGAAAVVTTVPCTGNPGTDGDTLSRAVAAANTSPGDDTLELQPCTYQISAPLQVTEAGSTLTITGGAIDGNGSTALLEVGPAGRLLLNGVTLTRGAATTSGRGGAVSSAGELEVVASILTDNSGAFGGAIASSGTTRIRRSLFERNESTGNGTTLPGKGNHVYVLGGLTSIDDSTLLAASGRSGSGAVAVTSSGVASLLGNTWAGNTNYTVFNEGGRVSARNNVITETADSVTCFGAIIDNGGNLSTDDSCGFTDPTSRNAVSTALLPLANYGGPTNTRPLAPGAAGLNLGGTDCGGADQRGVSRPQGEACDSGAVESTAALSLSPQSSQYPATESGSSSAQTFTATSAGQDPLLLGPVRVDGSPAFAIARDTCSGRRLPSGSSCVVEVRFTPTDSFPQSAKLVFVDNAFNGPHSANAAGVGTVAAPSPTPVPPSASPAPPSASPTPSASPSASPRPTASARSTPTTTPSPIATTAAPTPGGSPAVAASAGPERRSDPAGGDEVSNPELFFTAFVPAPAEVSTTLRALVGSSLLALLLLALLSLPVTVVNETLTQHREDVARQLAWLRGRLAALPHVPRLKVDNLPQGAAVILAAAGGAFINSFLNPSFALNRASAIGFLGLLSSLLLLTAVTRLCCDSFCERRFRANAVVRVLPGFWVLALTCVVLSRTTGFRPGLILGTLAAVQVGRALNAQEEGEKTAIAYLVTVVTALSAWLAYGPVSDYVRSQSDPAFGVLVFQTVLATIFLGGVGGSLFGLVPLDFLDGAKLRRWNPLVWFAFFFAALFGFVHVLLRHTSRTDSLLDNVGYLQALLGIYLVSAAAFWGYWRWHDRRKAQAAG